MISKKISCKPANDNFKRLGNYIADANHAGEKNLMRWSAGCMMDDYQDVLTEIVDTQALNTRTKKAKTYHLVISFNPEDETRLGPDQFKEIEESFAQVLGLEAHQRVCGVHKNTRNIHMHVAYNLVHPEKLTFHEPFRDYLKRDRLCRELEKKYGLKIDNGRQEIRDPQKLTEPAARIEIQTGEQSFEGYVKSHRKELLTGLESATKWEHVHAALATYGLLLNPKGNGLMLTDLKGKTVIKASTFDRNFSKGALESRFGKFCKAQERLTKPISQYSTLPIHRAPERGQLFSEYKAQVIKKRALWDAIIQDERAELSGLFCPFCG